MRQFLNENASLMATIPLAGLAVAAMASPTLAQDAPIKLNGEVPALPPADSSMLSRPQDVGPSGDGLDPRSRLGWSVVPRLTLSETFTNNVNPGSGSQQADQVTEISPGILIKGNSVRSKVYFDYQGHQFLYARESEYKNTQHFLNTFGTLEAVENWLYLEFNGSISQQPISPFGLQSPTTATINPNRTEVSNFRLSPYIRGRLGGYADYEIRYSRSAIHSRSEAASDVDTGESIIRMTGATPFASLAWSVELSRQNLDYRSAREIEADYFRGMLAYQLDPQFKLLASGGREANDYLSSAKESDSTYGYGFKWSPTGRTLISAFREKRFFGYGHNIVIAHRMPLSAWKFTDTRNVSVLPNQLGTAGLGTIYDLIFNQLASSVHDPIARAEEVDALLQQYALAPNVQVTGGFLNSGPILERRQELSFMLRGARNMLTLSAARSEYQELGVPVGPNDPFAASPSIRQRGINVTVSHRLSPLSTLNLTATRQDNSGSESNGSTTQKSLNAALLTRLNASIMASLAARRTIFASTTSPYSENALTGSLVAQF